MKKEKLQVLNMISEGKISAEEGMKLLEALEDNNGSTRINQIEGRKYLRIRVYEPGDNTKVNVTIPASIFRLGFKFISKFSPELKDSGLSEIDIEELLHAVDSGQIGKIVEVDAGDGTKVEILVE